MGVDYYSCNYCERSFPDVIDYVFCECGKVWCCIECAKEDGFQFDIVIDEDGDEVYSDEDGSCKYCRNEDVEDSELLLYLLTKCNLSKSDAKKECLDNR